jgi:hypothetical protein
VGAAFRRIRLDLVVAAAYLGAAVAIFERLWRHPGERLLANNFQDHAFFEWVLAHAAYCVTQLHNPLITTRLNAPDGVNMMANTSMLTMSIPLTPVTLIWGPSVSYVLVLTLALFGTATAWYYVLSRYLVSSRLAAFVGGAFCGFAPSMISHANGHPNLIGQFLLPLILVRVIKLREPGRAVRNGLCAGVLVVLQAFINEELLFLTALAFGVFVVGYAVSRPAQVRSAIPAFLRGAGVTTAFTLVLLAYPLYVQFFGPQRYDGLPAGIPDFSADLASFWTYPRQSLGGSKAVTYALAQNATEENTFFGWPLLMVLAVIVVWRRREPMVRALAATGAVFALGSLGRRVIVHGMDSGFAGPWALLAGAPVFHLIVPTRLALVLVPVVGALLAIAVDRIVVGVSAGTDSRRGAIGIATAWLAFLAAALLPIVPTPIPVADRPPTPHFITAGTWRQYVAEDQSLVTFPLGWYGQQDAMRWTAQQRLGFRIPEGYFLGPDPAIPRDTLFGTRPTLTSWLISDVEAKGRAPAVTEEQRQQARADAGFWHAAAVVVPVSHRNAEPMRQTLDQLYGPGRLVDDVWLWDVRDL